jgi:hypothetical protein
MNAEKEQELKIARMIERDAPTQGIDLADTVNASFTVWAGGFSDRMQYCGSRKTLDDAWMLARQHVNLRSVYVYLGKPNNCFGITKFQEP